jgi:hypothetical protein
VPYETKYGTVNAEEGLDARAVDSSAVDASAVDASVVRGTGNQTSSEKMQPTLNLRLLREQVVRTVSQFSQEC